MTTILRFARLLACSSLLALGAAAVTSCEKPDCGCTIPPVEPVTSAAFTRVDTWWLNEASLGTQVARTTAIKDRFSLQFRPDGSYTQTLLADGTTFTGTWMLMGADSRTLHYTDHKGAPQEFTIEKVNNDVLVYRRTLQDGQMTAFVFNPTRQ